MKNVTDIVCMTLSAALLGITLMGFLALAIATGAFKGAYNAQDRIRKRGAT